MWLALVVFSGVPCYFTWQSAISRVSYLLRLTTTYYYYRYLAFEGPALNAIHSARCDRFACRISTTVAPRLNLGDPNLLATDPVCFR